MRSPTGSRTRAAVAALAALVALAPLAACGERDEPSSPTVPGPTTTLAPAADPAGDGPVEVALVPVATDLAEPIDLVPGPRAGTVLVAERAGAVREATVTPDGLEVGDEVLDVTGLVGSTESERGLLGIEVHPDGDRLYVSYTAARDGASTVDEFRLRAGRADPDSRRTLLRVEQPYPNHNGGQIRFAPDGSLLVGLGDGGAAGDPEGRAQDPDSLLGKLIALDVDDDEPEPRVVAVGLRNPWRFSFDPGTGDLWVADVGQDLLEEVNVVRAEDGPLRGLNFGWDLFEGDQPFGDSNYDPADVEGPFVEPVFTYGRDAGCSITGGVVYRGTAIPALVGSYLFTDLCQPQLRTLTQDGRAATLPDGAPTVVAFGVDGDGEVYLLSLSDGVFRLTPG
jgi:glucose/arabinose dehydrogenase